MQRRSPILSTSTQRVARPLTEPSIPRAFVHQAFFYEESDDYVRTLGDFACGGIAAGEPVLISVPGEKLALLRSALPNGDGITFFDMEQVGKNPARILPAIAGFFARHAGRRVRFVGEPIWHGRSACETVEGVRHEALINTAFATSTGTIVCPYDVSRLDGDVIADAERTHPELTRAGATTPSATYTAPLDVYAAGDRPLGPPSGPVATLAVAGDLEALRRWIVSQVPAHRLSSERTAALVLAANEAVSNTLVHAGGRGTARIWHEDDEIVCEIADAGCIGDPLAGRRAPGVDWEGGRGLWLINHFCDLTELRSGPDGTVLRLHMSFD